MIRTIEITVPQHQSDELISHIKGIGEIIGIRLQKNISLQPPGDVITVELTDTALHGVMKLLAEKGFLKASGVSVTTSMPASIISSSSPATTVSGPSTATWEEMETALGFESNITVNGLILMFVSGIFAAIGIATNVLHYVIAAMVVAPGFEPLSRIALGAATHNRAWRRGFTHTLMGYAALILGAALTTLLLSALNVPALGGKSSYLPPNALISYWTTISAASLIVSASAAVAGAVLIVAYRLVLTAGVMIALSLIPAATLMGMSIAAGDYPLFMTGLLRWSIDAGFVVAGSVLVFALRRVVTLKRKMFL